MMADLGAGGKQTSGTHFTVAISPGEEGHHAHSWSIASRVERMGVKAREAEKERFGTLPNAS
jgi:hypothetical protein